MLKQYTLLCPVAHPFMLHTEQKRPIFVLLYCILGVLSALSARKWANQLIQVFVSTYLVTKNSEPISYVIAGIWKPGWCGFNFDGWASPSIPKATLRWFPGHHFSVKTFQTAVSWLIMSIWCCGHHSVSLLTLQTRKNDVYNQKT